MKNVINSLWLSSTIFLLVACQVMHGERTTSQYMSDASITSTVKYKLARSRYVPAARIHVETDKGVVQLSGFVKTEQQKNVATNITKHVKGVIAVKNNITTYHEAHSKQPMAKVTRELTYDYQK